jgi:hypothetical protein
MSPSIAFADGWDSAVDAFVTNDRLLPNGRALTIDNATAIRKSHGKTRHAIVI